MKTFHLEPQANIKAEAFASAPAKVVCVSKQAAEAFRYTCYRYRTQYTEYSHIELKLKDNAVYFLPRRLLTNYTI